MDNRPKALTEDEFDEIAALREIQEMWGAENSNEMVGILRESVYSVKFHFVSGGPGYVGDLYVLFGDTLEEPVKLIRKNGALEITD